MKLNHIAAQNFQIIGHLDLPITAPIVAICGLMEQGKSSLAEAVRLALTGSPTRVELKKDYPALIRDGNKKGAVSVDTNAGRASFTLPKGEHATTVAVDDVVPILLQPHRFAKMPEQERRALLFRLCNVSAKPDEVIARMLKRGCDAKLSDEIRPLLLSGFDAAHKDAKERVSEARIGWKTLTGEAYGENKADGWQADKPAFDAQALEDADAELTLIDASLQAERVKLGEAKGALNAARVSVAERASLKELADKVGHQQELLNIARAELADFMPKVEELRSKASGKPKNAPQLLHDLATLVGAANGWNDDSMLALAKASLEQYESEYGTKTYDPDAATKLIEYEASLKVLQNAVASRERDHSKATGAAVALESVAEVNIEELEAAVTAASESVDELECRRVAVSQSYVVLSADKAKAEAADQLTARAAALHKTAVDWTVVVEALAPEGIPGDLLAEAIKPVNERLRETATATGWPAVAIGADMSIRMDSRLYKMGSESAQWRADAAIAEALSHISGHRFFMLDRIDVLDVPARGVLFRWLDQLAASEEVETVIVIGTFTERPRIPMDTVQVEWIQSGELIAA